MWKDVEFIDEVVVLEDVGVCFCGKCFVFDWFVVFVVMKVFDVCVDDFFMI